MTNLARHLVLWLCCFWACIPPGGWGAPNYSAQAPFTGTFAAQGGQVTLDQQGDRVTGTAVVGSTTAQLEGKVGFGGQMRGTARANGKVVGFTASASPQGLQLAVDGGSPIFLARSAGGGTPGGGQPPPSLGPPTAAMGHLAGTWWHYRSTSSSYGYSPTSSASASFEHTIELCADGRFFDSNTSNIQSQVDNRNAWDPNATGGTYAARIGEGGGAGRWTAEGDDAQGSLTLAYADGTVQQKQYVFKKRGGGDIELDGRWYGYSNDKGGQCR